jgi:Flp pilus assembly pilin Flp
MMTRTIRRNSTQKRKGAALVEYAMLIAGVALISAAALSVFGHKTSDLIGAVAAVLPGAHADDNGPVTSGKLIETTTDGTTGAIELGVADITAATNTPRLGVNVGLDSPTDFGGLILEAN